MLIGGWKFIPPSQKYMLTLAFDPYWNKGTIHVYAHPAHKEGRAIVAKDMSGIYGEMLTKELVGLRARHLANLDVQRELNKRGARAEADRLQDLIHQINAELANRIASFNLFV